MSTFYTTQGIYGYMRAEINRIDSGTPLFPNHPGVTQAQAEQRLREARNELYRSINADELDENFVIPAENAPVDYGDTRLENYVRNNPELSEYYGVLSQRYNYMLDLTAPEFAVEETPEYLAMDADEQRVERIKQATFVMTGNYLRAPESLETLREIIEKYPLDPVNPHQLQFVPENERENRRLQSEAMRKAIIEEIVHISDVDSTYKLGRAENKLIYRDSPKDRDPRNAEIARIFAKPDGEKNRADYHRKLVDDIMQADPTGKMTREEAEQQLAEEQKSWPRRRAEIVMLRARAAYSFTGRIDEMTDLSLPVDKLVENYRIIREASSVMYECGSYLDDGNAGFIDFTPEEKEELQQCKDVQEKFANAVERVAAIANPCYEFLDYNELSHYNVDLIRSELDDRHDGFKRPLGKFALSLDDYLIDKQHINTQISVPLHGKVDAVLNEYGIVKQHFESKIPGLVDKEFSDSLTEFGNDTICADDTVMGFKPLAVQHGSRALVITRIGGVNETEIAIDRPETLYNKYLNLKTRKLTALMNEADPFYIISSPEFREMKKRFKRIRELPPLPDNLAKNPAAAARTIAKYRRMYRDLSNQCDVYLKYKGTEGENDLEERRIRMAQTLKKYSEAKLQQLSHIELSVETLARLYNLAPEERKKIISEDLDLENNLHRQILEAKEAEKNAKKQQNAGNEHAANQNEADNISEEGSVLDDSRISVSDDFEEENQLNRSQIIKNANALGGAADGKELNKSQVIENPYKLDDASELYDGENVIIDDDEHSQAENVADIPKNKVEERKTEVRRTTFRESVQVDMENAFENQQQRISDPVGWLREKSKIYEDIHPTIKHALSAVVNDVNNLALIGRMYDDSSFARLSGLSAAGIMIGAELVKGERRVYGGENSVPGPLEGLFTGKYEIAYTSLLTSYALEAKYGEIPMKTDPKHASEFNPRHPEQYCTAEQYKEFMESFEPEKLAPAVKEKFMQDPMVKPVVDIGRTYLYGQKLQNANQLTETEKALQKFAGENIIPNAVQYMSKYSGAHNNPDILCGQKLLVDCVVFNLIQIESMSDKAEPEKLEKMLTEPDKLSSLRKLIENSQEYGEMAKNLLKPNVKGSLRFDSFTKAILDDKLPAKIAMSIQTGAVLSKVIKTDASQQKVYEADLNVKPVNKQAKQMNNH